MTLPYPAPPLPSPRTPRAMVSPGARLLKKHLTNHPNDLAVVRDLGLASYQLGQYQQAMNLPYLLLRSDPADHHMLAAYGIPLKGLAARRRCKRSGEKHSCLAAHRSCRPPLP